MSERVRILVIAPNHPDLPQLQAEAAAIASRHSVEMLLGDVRERDVRNAVRGARYDIIWWITHGDEEQGLLLSDGWLPADAAARFVEQGVKRTGKTLTVLSTCSSKSVARSIVSRSSADAICYVAAIGDVEAARTGIGLSDRLDENRNYFDAYLAAKPDDDDYEYIVNPRKLIQMYDGNGETRNDGRPPFVNGQLSRQVLENQVNIDALSRRLDASDRNMGLLLEKLDKALDEMRKTAYSTTVVNQPPQQPPQSTQAQSWENRIMMLGMLAALLMIAWFIVSAS